MVNQLLNVLQLFLKLMMYTGDTYVFWGSRRRCLGSVLVLNYLKRGKSYFYIFFMFKTFDNVTNSYQSQ